MKEKEQFVKIPLRIMHDDTLTPFDKVVYGVIRSFNPSFPSYEKIAKLANMSRSQVAISIKSLEYFGIIKKIKLVSKRGHINKYSFGLSKENDAMPVHHMKGGSPPYGLPIVHHMDSNQINPHQIKFNQINLKEKDGDFKDFHQEEEDYQNVSTFSEIKEIILGCTKKMPK
jgi:DNA-binding Lrp family transcriptional regulator